MIDNYITSFEICELRNKLQKIIKENIKLKKEMEDLKERLKELIGE